MKARIGITAPLQLTTRAAGTLVLPYFAQRNFSVPASVKHSIIIDSKDRFLTQAAPMVAEPASPAPFAHVTVERPAGTPDVAWAPDTNARSSRFARRRSCARRCARNRSPRRRGWSSSSTARAR